MCRLYKALGMFEGWNVRRSGSQKVCLQIELRNEFNLQIKDYIKVFVKILYVSLSKIATILNVKLTVFPKNYHRALKPPKKTLNKPNRAVVHLCLFSFWL